MLFAYETQTLTTTNWGRGFPLYKMCYNKKAVSLATATVGSEQYRTASPPLRVVRKPLKTKESESCSRSKPSQQSSSSSAFYNSSKPSHRQTPMCKTRRPLYVTAPAVEKCVRRAANARNDRCAQGSVTHLFKGLRHHNFFGRTDTDFGSVLTPIPLCIFCRRN